MRADSPVRALVAGAALLVGTGCAGSRTTLVADDSRYPISLSRAVRDADGEIATQDRVRKVGRFHSGATSWATLYSTVKLTPRTDISEKVNAQIAAVGGDAIVNLRVRSSHCAWDFFAVLNVFPLWPGCSKVEVDGDIVTVAPKAVQP